MSSFKEKTSIENGPRSSRPKQAAILANLETVDKLVRANRRVKVKKTAE